MKYMQRLGAFLLTLVILGGLLPATGGTANAAEASTYTGTPTAEIVQVVIDFSKTVDISLSEVKAGIHTNRNGSVGNLLGFIDNGSSGFLMSSDPEMDITAKGDSFDAGNGTVKWVDDTKITYTPSGIISHIDYIYAVYALNGSTAGTRIMVEIQIIPADMVYYEAEALVHTDLELIDTDNVSDEAPGWSTKEEGDSADTRQDSDPGIDRITNMTIDRKNIPGGAFFVDFLQNSTKLFRYTNDAIFDANRNFDNPDHWRGYNVGTDSVSNTPGYYTLALTASTSTHYIQTTTYQSNAFTSSPLRFRPTKDDYFQIRFRMTKCKDATAPSVTLNFKNTSASGDVNTTAANALTLSLDADNIKRLNNEEYVTLTKSLSSLPYYTGSNMIYSLRITVNGVTSESGAQLIVDYIYMGAPTGLMVPKPATETQYLYFNFGVDEVSESRYTSTVYANRNYNNVNAWSCDDGTSTLVASNNGPGYLRLDDNKNWASGNQGHYNYAHSGESDKTNTMKFVPKDGDVFKIKFYLSEECTKLTSTGVNSNKFTVLLEGNPTGATSASTQEYGRKAFTWSNHYKNYYEVTIALTSTTDNRAESAANYKSLISGNKTLGSVRPAFWNVDDGKIYIDYIYIGPSSIASTVINESEGADPYFFADFTATDNDAFRYTNKTYGNQNFDKMSYWKQRGDTYFTKTMSGGLVTLTDKMTEATEDKDYPDKTYLHNLYIGAENLQFPAGNDHYYQTRLKISGTNLAADKHATPNVHVEYTVDGTSYNSYNYPISLSDVKDKYITVTFKLSNNTYYKSGKTITKMLFVIGGTQNATIQIDYVYCGPAIYSVPSEAFDPTQSSNPASKTLYFDFDNRDPGRFTGSGKYALNDTHALVSGDSITAKDYDANASTWSIGGNASSRSISTSYGILSVPLSTANWDGPILTAPNLNYHPYNGTDALQVRFRLNGCTGGANPRVEARLTGYLDTASNTYSSSRIIADSDNFQTILLPLNAAVMKCTTITKLELQFYDIQGGTLEIDHIYVGDGTVNTTVPVYGYDSAYTNDSLLSDGASLFVEGDGVRLDPKQAELDNGTYTYPEQYTEATFSFTGTGVDIISRTGPDQGAIRVSLYKALPMTQENLERFLTVNNKGELQLYQIPVASFHGLEHGTYHVKIAVNKGVTSSYDFLARGDDFYFDAIRVYDPIDVSGNSLTVEQQSAKDAYRGDKEAHTYVKELRDSLLSVANFNAALLESGKTSGALFIDSTIKYVVSTEPTEEAHEKPTVNVDEVPVNHRVVTVEDYKNIGPKNEVYLAPGQAIAFKLEKDTAAKIVSIDVGAKTVLGDGAVLSAGFVSAVDSNTLTTVGSTKWNVNSASAQYFPLDESKLTVGTDVYLVIYNAHTDTDKTKNILSVTDLKVCYDREPTRTDLPQDGTSPVTDLPAGGKRNPDSRVDPYHFAVDTRTVEAAEVFLNGEFETPVEEASPVMENIHFYHSLNLASDISVNYLIPEAELDGYDTIRMEILTHFYDVSGEIRKQLITPEPVVKNGYYYFTLSDLNATRLNDKIEATVYLTKEGKDYYSQTDLYSIADYAYAQLDKSNASEELKTLCADLLVYGAKAQIYKDYRTDALADEAMSEFHRSYCTDLEALTFGNNNLVLEDMESPTVAWKGKALSLDSRVGILYIIDTTSYEGDPSALSLHLTYVDGTGTEQTVTLTDPALYREGTAWYAFDFYGLLASELRTVVSARVYAGDTALSQTLSYSADTYGNDKTGTLGDLCRALFAYSDSAKTFFGD